MNFDVDIMLNEKFVIFFFLQFIQFNTVLQITLHMM